jgi:hypothetical protein
MGLQQQQQQQQQQQHQQQQQQDTSQTRSTVQTACLNSIHVVHVIHVRAMLNASKTRPDSNQSLNCAGGWSTACQLIHTSVSSLALYLSHQPIRLVHIGTFGTPFGSQTQLMGRTHTTDHTAQLRTPHSGDRNWGGVTETLDQSECTLPGRRLHLCGFIWCGGYRSTVKASTCNTPPPV